MTTAGRPSTTAPKKMKTTAVITRKTRLLARHAGHEPDQQGCGSCCTVRNHEITAAVAEQQAHRAGHHAGLDEDARAGPPT